MYYLPRSKGLPVLLTLPVTGEPGLDEGVREEMVVVGIGSLKHLVTNVPDIAVKTK